MDNSTVRGLRAVLFFLSLSALLLPVRTGEGSEPRVSKKHGETILTLTAAEQKNGGIITAPLKTMVHRKELRVFGRVLPLQGLADFRTRYLQGEAQMEGAAAKLEASKKEYERVKRLYAQRNVSDKTLQAAEAVWQVDAVNARAAKEALPVLRSEVRLKWGDVIGGWLFEGSADFQQLMQNKEVLVQITFQPGTQVSPMPEKIEIRGASGSCIAARLVSPAPVTDPRIQGLSFFYVAPPEKILLSGMNVVAYVPTSPREPGFFIPGSAVVWSEGAPWAYVRRDREQFARRKVPDETPFEEGYFATKGFYDREQLVIQGAQLLLSEEFRARIQGGN